MMKDLPGVLDIISDTVYGKIDVSIFSKQDECQLRDMTQFAVYVCKIETYFTTP